MEETTSGKSDRPSAGPVSRQWGIAGATVQPFRVLVVEDGSLLRLNKSMMAWWPMSPVVSLANNAYTGLWLMGRYSPDLLIVDLSMPDMDGFQMLRVLHQTLDMTRTTIVAVTGLDTATAVLRGGVPAGIEVLPKPIPFDRLLAIANGIFNSRQRMFTAGL